MKIFSSKTFQLTAVLAAALTLSGCAAGMEPGAATPNQSGVEIADSTAFSSMDIMFAQMMIPHHQQAVDMGVIAAAKSSDEEVLKLAAAISSEQEPEIELMRSWLTAAGASEDMGHAMHGMDGMLTEEQMAALLNASGSEFDELFLRGMIAHHEGAIDMAQMVIDSANPEVRGLAEAIVASQQEQIQYMQELLAK